MLIGWLAGVVCALNGHTMWAAIMFSLGILIAVWIIIRPTRPEPREEETGGTVWPTMASPPTGPDPAPAVDVATRPMMHGTPGIGLSDGVFGVERTAAGMSGEHRLADLLADMNVDDHAQVWFSLKIPRFEDVDVDCAILSGRDLWLVDAKLWKAGDAMYTRTNPDTGARDDMFHLVDMEGREVVAYRVKRTMVMAGESYRRLLPHMTVRTVTLLCPTSGGTAGVMTDATCADGTRLRQSREWVADDLLPIIRDRDADDVDPAAARQLDGLLKAGVAG